MDAPQVKPPRPRDWMRGSFSDQLAELVHRINVAFDGASPRIIQFISARQGEGVTSTASAYADAVADVLKRRVLLVQVNAERRGPRRPPAPAPAASTGDDGEPPGAADMTIVGYTMAGRPIHLACQQRSSLLYEATFASDCIDKNEILYAVSSASLWGELKDGFDEIVIDSPSIATSRLGVLISSYSDGVVVVVEAEKTRGPVVQVMLNNLVDVHANIIGAIFNNRRFYIPRWLYGWL